MLAPAVRIALVSALHCMATQGRRPEMCAEYLLASKIAVIVNRQVTVVGAFDGHDAMLLLGAKGIAQ